MMLYMSNKPSVRQAKNPQEVLKKSSDLCRQLGIDHTTIQVHDESDPHFCYSATCDWEHGDVTAEELLEGQGRNNLCVTKRT